MGVFLQVLTILAGIGSAFTAVGVVAYFVFQVFAKSWIENKFTRELELYKQKLKIEIDLAISRNLKLQAKEFELLPDLWYHLSDAVQALQRATNPIPNTLRLVDLENADNDQKKMIFRKFDLPDDDVEMLLKDSVIDRSLIEQIIHNDRIIKSHSKAFALVSFIDKNRIFLSKDIVEATASLNSLMRNSFLEVESRPNKEGREVRSEEVRKKIEEELVVKYQRLGEVIRERLSSNVVQAGFADREDQ